MKLWDKEKEFRFRKEDKFVVLISVGKIGIYVFLSVKRKNCAFDSLYALSYFRVSSENIDYFS